MRHAHPETDKKARLFRRFDIAAQCRNAAAAGARVGRRGGRHPEKPLCNQPSMRHGRAVSSGHHRGTEKNPMGASITFARPDGGSTKAYLATAGQGRPGIVVIQEWWGLNDQICGVADRFARAGYNALAPDLYKGRLAATADEAGHLMTGLDFPDATHQDLRGAARHLEALGGKVAAMGFCMGGALTVAAAVHVPEIDAAVCFYGIPPRDFADPATIRVPFQGHFANQDDWCTPSAVDTLEAALTGKHEIFRYDAAHAFFNERSAAYDVACAGQAWDRMARFLAAAL
jgi:carboxymethylenebutenolidase